MKLDDYIENNKLYRRSYGNVYQDPDCRKEEGIFRFHKLNNFFEENSLYESSGDGFQSEGSIDLFDPNLR
jgi:hypothetical protein